MVFQSGLRKLIRSHQVQPYGVADQRVVHHGIMRRRAGLDPGAGLPDRTVLDLDAHFTVEQNPHATTMTTDDLVVVAVEGQEIASDGDASRGYGVFSAGDGGIVAI